MSFFNSFISSFYLSSSSFFLLIYYFFNISITEITNKQEANILFWTLNIYLDFF
uniref:Uncharacterized protein n=1 Tax=Meloidogyne enterolobii TaxID=390850 RepID=A0A6V7XP40_MELEN|nr:unnamed protein product [Meloidogyne enterolobii]